MDLGRLIPREKKAELERVCNRRGVQRLAAFGSAVRGDFDPARSDLDLVVQFAPLAPIQHADSYFGLQEDLERLFGVPVDLIEYKPIRNPYFREMLERTQVVLYEAA